MDDEAVPSELRRLLDTHPCYNEKACKKFARMHLPVAPACNVQCNYCNRKYDCSNESRPGVTSEVLTPEEAVEKVRYVRQKIPYLSVIGIAGPGDPLANESTFRTLELVSKAFPDMTLCLSTNGLNLANNVDRLKALGVKFVTITINAVDPEIAAKMYQFVIWEGKVLRGLEAGKRMVENQLLGLRKAVEAGMLVKVNTVMVPGVNSHHIPEVAKKVKELGAYIVNILPLIPVPGTPFAEVRPPTPRERKELQDICEPKIKQMRHCRQCRADAIGLLDEDRSAEFAHITCGEVKAPLAEPAVLEIEGKAKHRIAVASSDGRFVDLGFGMAEKFYVFSVEEGNVVHLGELQIDAKLDEPVFGKTHRAKLEGATLALKGHDAVVANEFSPKAVQLLKAQGIAAYTSKDDVEKAVREASENLYKKRVEIFE